MNVCLTTNNAMSPGEDMAMDITSREDITGSMAGMTPREENLGMTVNVGELMDAGFNFQDTNESLDHIKVTK